MSMYLDHFGLREAPFRITPHTEFFFAGANRGATLEALMYAITSGEGIVKVVGEVGSGKTMLCRVLMERLPDTVETIYLAVPSVTRDEMLSVIAGDLGLEAPVGHTTKLLRALQDRLIKIHSAGKRVVALVDEAHAMPQDTLEEIRLLSNLETSRDKLMQIVLFGQPELDTHLAAPNMRPLKERITHAFNLAPLPPRDIRDYLDFRLRAAGYKGPDLFDAETIRIIAEASEGLTRRINIYADKTLLSAFAAGTHTVLPDHARAAIADTGIVLKKSFAPRRVYAATFVAVAAGLLIGFYSGRFLGGRENPPAIAASPTATSNPALGIPSSARIQEQPPREAASAVVPVTSPIPAAPAAKAKSDQPQNLHALIHQPLPPSVVPPNLKNGSTWLEARLKADSDRLAVASPDYWSIQLMTADRREQAAIENFLGEAGKLVEADDLIAFPSGRKDYPRISVIYGVFPSMQEAQIALARLPPRVASYGPYVRSFQVIREDMQRTTR